ncbi:hypothetical protein [Streptomyces sp. NPDC096323]|uniref:hypothetical protein n=1 Tax=Streptomyces sp. NPDC096323 TaxID=3155822 RepID=UPI0033324742
MSTFKISTPVPEFHGKVAGVWFANGEAETDSEGAVAYFRRHGYTVEAVKADPNEQAPAETDAKAKAPARAAKG